MVEHAMKIHQTVKQHLLNIRHSVVAFMLARAGVGGVVIRPRRVIFRLIGAIPQRRRDFPGRQDKD